MKDDQGRKVDAEKVVILFASDDKRPPVSMPLWCYEVNTRFDAAHPALFYFGTSEKDTYVLMDVFCGNKHLESKLLLFVLNIRIGKPTGMVWVLPLYLFVKVLSTNRR